MKHKLRGKLITAEKTNSQRLSIDSLLQLDSGPPLPSGWEKCLDLKSGVVYFKNRISGVKSYRPPLQLLERNLSKLETPKVENASKVQCNTIINLELALGSMNDGNYSSNPRQREPKEEDLELRLRLPGAAADIKIVESMQSTISSVSLERQLIGLLPEPAPAPSPSPAAAAAPRTSNSSSSSSPSSSTTQVEDMVASEAESSRKTKRPRRRADCSQVMVTVGCRECLMYVMLSKDNPRCPKCGNTVLLDFHSNKSQDDEHNQCCWSHHHNITCT